MKIFDRPINPGEVKVPILFDFTARIPSGVTISGTPQFDAAVWNAGADGTPNHVDGGPVVSAGQVVAYWTGGNAGVDYRLRCRAALSNGTTRALTVVIPVRDNG